MRRLEVPQIDHGNQWHPASNQPQTGIINVDAIRSRQKKSSMVNSELIRADRMLKLQELLSQIPMPDIPFSEHRKTGYSDLEEQVSYHELLHSVCLESKVAEISIEPEGDSLGRTIFYGSVSDEEMQISAAASSIAVGKYRPMGTGDDWNQVMEAHAQGGLNPEEAMSKAGAKLNGLSADHLGIMAEILAFKKKISGDELVVLRQRADFELKLRPYQDLLPFAEKLSGKGRLSPSGNQQAKRLVDSVFPNESSYQTQRPIYEVMTVKEHLVGDQVRTYKKVNGVKDQSSEKTYCDKCKGENTHASSCIHFGKEKEVKEVKESPSISRYAVE